jgi:hypothetical protein
MDGNSKAGIVILVNLQKLLLVLWFLFYLVINKKKSVKSRHNVTAICRYTNI